MRLARRHRPEPWLPFISLADIAWQIIIFFVIAASFMYNDALSVPLPSAAPGKEAPVRQTIVVLASERELSVNGVVVTMAGLEQHLSALLGGATSDDERAVVIRPSDDLTFQRNAELLYAVQHAGGVPVISEERRVANRAEKE